MWPHLQAVVSSTDCSRSFLKRVHFSTRRQARTTVRRERAMDVARRVNAAQHLPSPRGPRYRPLEELRSIPPLPDGFDLQFHTDGRSYTFSLKDRLDPCRFAVFSDQDGAVYAAAPQPQPPTVLPLETR